MKKRTILFTLACSFALTCPAYGQIGVAFNGTPVAFTDSTGRPVIDENGRTLVPLRASMEAMGCTVNWYEPSKTAYVLNGDTTVSVPIGTSFIYRNGVSIPNDTSAQIINGRVYLPIRAVLEAFGATVAWDESTQTVSARYTPPVPSYSDEELRRMERELERLERQKELEERRAEMQAEIDRIHDDIDRRQEEAKNRLEEIQNSLPDTPSRPQYDPYESLTNTGGYGNSWAISHGVSGDFTGGYGSTYEDASRSQAYDRYLEHIHDLP